MVGTNLFRSTFVRVFSIRQSLRPTVSLDLRTFCDSSTNGNAKSSDPKPQDVLDNRDPAPYFINPQIQELLKRLTGLNLEKVYRPVPNVKRMPPRYHFMTESQLQEAMTKAKKEAECKLQMPPVMKAREPKLEVISRDPDIIGYATAKYVFVDISHGVKDRARLIVVRDLDGTLRKASWEEREKMNQIFFPVNKKKLSMPRMFLDDNLKGVLDQEAYEFILDRTCLQFEPDDPVFIKICHQTYDHVDKMQKYDILHSTRHYGPMIFYLTFYGIIDNILLHLIQNDRMEEANDVVKLYCLVKPDSRIAKAGIGNSPLETVKLFTKLNSTKTSSLELAIQTYEELQHQQQKYIQDVKEAHGQV